MDLMLGPHIPNPGPAFSYIQIRIGQRPPKHGNIAQRNGVLGIESHDQNVDGDQDASSANASTGGDHEAEGGECESEAVGGGEGEEGFVVGFSAEESV